MRLVKDTHGAVANELPLILPPGVVVPGTRYRVISKIGEGAMGDVYMAEHVDLEKRVALKLLHATYARVPDAVDRFRQEARAASKVGSPYICDVTDFGHTPDGRVFFVMEYLDGQSLRAVVGTQGPLAASRLIGILRQTAKALGAAHEKGIIHLDVKPDNVMVREIRKRPDAVKVVDFGIAGLMHTQEKHDTISGTPEYIAPERALGRGYDHRSDIYSLGVMSYELLTGRLPFVHENVTELLKKHVGEAPERPRTRLPTGGIPAELETVVMQMLAKDPAARPQNMAVVEALLCEAQIAAGISTPWDDLDLPAVDEAWHKKLVERMPHPRGGQRKALALVASGVALAAVAVAIYLGNQDPRIEVKTVYVEVAGKKTAEAEAVADWLSKAVRAANERKYSVPATDSALFYLDNAEAEAERATGKKSEGVALYRQAYAQALALAGDELLRADLHEAGVAKFKEALLFQGADPQLQAKANLTTAERKAFSDRSRARPTGRPAAPKVVSFADEAGSLAGNAYIAATKNKFSEARLAIKKLSEVDTDGLRAAKLADALRMQGRAAWVAGRHQDAQPYYSLVKEIDPKDQEAIERARVEVVVPPVPVAAAADTAAAVGQKGRDSFPDAPRDIGASRAASSLGMAALSTGKLSDAESAFNRAVRLDPTNPAALGGLAEVAFERARYTEALDYGRNASKLAPKSARYLMTVGDAYFKLMRFKESLAVYNKAQALSPDDPRIKGRRDRAAAQLAKP